MTFTADEPVKITIFLNGEKNSHECQPVYIKTKDSMSVRLISLFSKSSLHVSQHVGLMGGGLVC